MGYASALLFALTMGVAVALGTGARADRPGRVPLPRRYAAQSQANGGVRGAALARAFLNSGPHDWRQLMNGQ